jgi:hypothetical protein
MGRDPLFPGHENDWTGHLLCHYGSISEELSNEHPSRSYMSRETDVETLNLALNQNFECLRRLTQMNGDTEPISIDKEESKRDSDTLYRSERSPLVLSHIWGPRKFVTSGCLAAIIYTDDQLRGTNFRA